MRDFPGPCPRCTSRNVAMLHATTSALYVICRACEHSWHLDADGVDPLRRHTSPAFRMTARIVASQSAVVSLG